MAKKLLIAGYYGFGNTGDEAILSSMIRDLRTLRPDTKIIVVSGNPSATRKLHRVKSIWWTDIKSIIEEMARSDLVLLGGGGLFHDYWGFDPNTLLTRNHSGIAYYSGISILATLLKKPLMLYAIGVGPLKSELGKRYTRFAFEQADIITIRDEQSRNLLIRLGIEETRLVVTADPALAGNYLVLQQIPKKLLPTKGPLLCAALRNWDIEIEPARWERQIAKALDLFIEKRKGGVIFVPFQELPEPEVNDNNIIERIRNQMVHKRNSFIMGVGLSFREKAKILSHCDIVLGMRLHALEFAIKFHKPLVGLEYDAKVRHLMGRIGLEDYSIRMKKITAKSLADLLVNSFDNQNEIIAKIKIEGQLLEAAANQNAVLAIYLLENPHPDDVCSKPISSEIASSVTLPLAQLVHDQQALLIERDKIIDQWRVALNKQVAERDKVIGEWRVALETQVGERDKMVTDLQEQHKRIIRTHEDQVKAYQEDIARRQNQVTQLSDALREIHTSRYWRILSLYWNFRELPKKIYFSIRSQLRKWLPYEVRRKLTRTFEKKVVKIQRPGNGQDEQSVVESIVIHEQSALSFLFPPRTRGYDVICLPIIDWKFRFQRPQQLINQFAQNGYRCFYINQSFQQLQNAPVIQKLADNIFNVELPGPVGINIYLDEISPETRQMLISSIKLLKQAAEIIDAACIVDLPFWFPLAEKMKELWGWKIIYDCMDDHAGFSTNSPTMLKHEKELIHLSDLVLASSKSIFNRCSQSSDRVVYLPNAAAFEHFNHYVASDPIPEITGPVIGYYGAISDWFDDELIYHSALKRPNWQFVLIGDTFGAELKLLQTLPNIHLLGEVPYDKLPVFLHRFDVACIPFKTTRLTLSTNPVKFYEYLSAGKPIVSVDLPELEQYSGYYYPVRSRDEFVEQVERAIIESSPRKSKLAVQLASQNTWKERYQLLSETIQSLYGKVAIIILSYDNLDYLKLCLNSIWDKTSYPNFEVIVVDNGSQPNVISYLKMLESQEPRLTVIYNKNNIGFARANNIGIRAAGNCEYIVLLNDDTIVTNGWLTRLVHCLVISGAKLVGPVTNNIGNEARIHVDYDGVNGIDQFSDQYSASHDGKFFDIPVLAMYCVIMRRSLLEEIGFLDERFGIGMFEDDDFSLRVHRSGGRIICAENVFIHHWGSAALKRMAQEEYNRLFDENLKKYEEKWQAKWQPHQYRD